MKPGYPYAKFPEYPEYTDEYRISKHDRLHLTLFSNNGETMVRIMGDQNYQQRLTTYRVEYDGTIRFPIIDRIFVEGMTLREAEKLIEVKYSEFYQDPFALLTVSDMKVLVFKGGNNAQVVTLEKPNTTLLEVMARTGGTYNVKTHRIKLVRGDLNNPEVYLIDLSTIDGLRQGNIILQSEDIIYLQPRDRVSSRIVEGLTPYLTLLSTVILILNIIK